MRFTLLITIFSLTFAFAETDPFNLDWKGQASFNHARSFEGSFDESSTTLRYIPQLRLDYQFSPTTRFGLDVAVDIYNHSRGDSLIRMDVEPYRFTIRYDTPRSQYRVGLQKINFGPARMLRVLQWFDQLDVRDPLALSPGVWAGMGRYYFTNGINLRLWLMADAPDQLRDKFGSNDKWPWDYGARMEIPIPQGTLGLTIHAMDQGNASGVSEMRAALDARVDVTVGLWSETMISKTDNHGIQSDIFAVMGGIDYTFGIGNGLYVALESMSYHMGHLDGDMPWQVRSIAIMANYTLGLADGLTSYIYLYDEPGAKTQVIPTIGWQHTRGNWLFYLALYDMPELATGGNIGLPVGTGLQLNIAFNH